MSLGSFKQIKQSISISHIQYSTVQEILLYCTILSNLNYSMKSYDQIKKVRNTNKI